MIRAAGLEGSRGARLREVAYATQQVFNKKPHYSVETMSKKLRRSRRKSYVGIALGRCAMQIEI